MKRQIRRIFFVAAVTACVFAWGLVTDSKALYDGILRLHVVGASDAATDQDVKLKVRDAVLLSLQEGLEDLTDPDAAVAYVTEMLPKVERAAKEALTAAGFSDAVTVSLTDEAFPAREYDTFSLPAGIYKALRIVIGEGEGKNWWCVVFPQLCMTTQEEFVETASVAGLSENLSQTLEGEYELRFWLLDKLGEWKNRLFENAQ